MPALAGPGGYFAMDIPHNTTWEIKWQEPRCSSRSVTAPPGEWEPGQTAGLFLPILCAGSTALGHRCPFVAQPAVGGRAEHVGSARVSQTSTCSAIAKASSTSIPRYLTVLSILVWPSSH